MKFFDVVRVGGGILAFVSANLSVAAEAPVVRLAADSWMPYNGEPGAEKSGYVVDFAREIFEAQGIKVEYVTMAWQDALAAAREGKIDGAICANKEEGKGLVLGSEPVGSPKMIMVTRPDSAWQFGNPASLKTIRLGVIADYSYWPLLDAYVRKADGTAVYVATGAHPLDDLLAKLDAGEIDVFIESEAVFAWKLRELNRDRDTIKVVYRHMPDEVFVAFTPTEHGKELAQKFDAGIKQMKRDGRADKIAKGYGLLSWQ